MRSASERGRFRWCWEQFEAEEVFNRNGEAFNWCCGLVNLFNLGWSGAVLFSPGMLDTAFGAGSIAWAPVLGAVPFVFSAFFFLIPIVRTVWMSGENERRRQRNAVRDAMRRLFTEHVFPEALVPFQPGSEVHGLVEALGGRQVEGGWVFDRLRQDMADVRAARQGTLQEKSRIGGGSDVVYSTETAPNLRTPTAA
ncbi:MAG: hypothetical protein ACYCW6_02775 [Candidatus Xenobia bacterium]